MPVTIPELHFSALKAIAQSPAHFRHYLERGRPDSASMRVGRAVHTLCLSGPDIAVFDGTRRGKEWEAFKTEHAGREILNATEYEQARSVAAAVKSHAEARRLIEGAHHTETSVEWERDGFKCAGRVDAFKIGSYVLDLKTGRDVRPDKFKWAVKSLGYAEQLAWYRDGLTRGAMTCPEAFIIAVESAAPHPVVVYRLTPRRLELAERTIALWLEELRNCLASDYWPGYAETTIDLDADDAGPEDGEWSDEEDAA